MRILAIGASVAGTALGLTMLVTTTSGAASGSGIYADWTVSGASSSATFPGTAFPGVAAQRTGGNWQVASGSSTWLTAGTPFGAQYGSSQGKDYLYTSLPLNGSTTTVTVTFDSPPTPGTWGFALGDVDAEDITITARDAAGTALDVASWFESAFNFCSVSPKPSACPAGAHTDLPSWSSPVLRGSANDTHGAAAWFRPTAAVSSLTFAQARNVAGAPIYQLWIAADVLASASPSTSASPSSASSSPSSSPSPTDTASPSATDSSAATQTSASATPIASPASSPSTEPSSKTVEPDAGEPAPPDTPQIVDVLDRSDAPEGSVVTDVDAPRHGTAQVVDDAVLYTPDPGYIGADRVIATVTTPTGAEITFRATVFTGREQQPTAPLGLPSSVTSGATTVLIEREVLTNAGQRASVRARCTPITRMQALGGFTGCRVTRDGSTVMVTVAGRTAYRVTVAVSAPRKDDYLPYRFKTTYSVSP